MTWPPRQYRETGRERQVDDRVVESALAISARLFRNGIPPVISLRHFAELTGANYQFLRGVIGRSIDPYYRFRMSKRRGGFRSIHSPAPALRRVQRWISDNVLRPLELRSPLGLSYAYAPGATTLRCAEVHRKCAWLIKIDVERFFESISEIQVYRVFLDAGFSELLAFELARLTTRPAGLPPLRWRHLFRIPPHWRARASYEIEAYRTEFLGRLPQGAPSSPMLANLACREMDHDMYAVARRFDYRYTRYSDDLAFSTTRTTATRSDATELIAVANGVLARHALRPNLTKIVVVPPGARKIVLGLGVDTDAVRIDSDLKDRIRMHLYFIAKYGAVAHSLRRGFHSTSSMVDHVFGLIAYIRTIEPQYGNRMRDGLIAILRNRQLLGDSID